MGDKKKGKALALELMDDLLSDKVEEVAVQKPKVPEPKKPVAETSDVETRANFQPSAEDEDFEFSKSVIHSSAPPIEMSSEPNTDPDPFEGHGTAISNLTDVSDPGPGNHTVVMKSAQEPRVPHDEDRTIRIEPSAVEPQIPEESAPKVESPAAGAPTRVRASVGRFGAFRSSGPASATEAALAQSESLRIAQSRLLEFEQEIERLRLQNEELAAAGETLRRRTDELIAANYKRESDYQNAVSTFRQEKEILIGSKEAVQRDLLAARQKSEELELRISTNIQKIRVRERELENRLELMKMESAALIRSKDEMILDLKRQIDQFNLELNNYRNKNQELNRQTTDKQEMLRRTVKALRLALSMLEGEEEAPKSAPTAPTPLRKVK